jgi:hypothetical protein
MSTCLGSVLPVRFSQADSHMETKLALGRYCHLFALLRHLCSYRNPCCDACDWSRVHIRNVGLVSLLSLSNPQSSSQCLLRGGAIVSFLLFFAKFKLISAQVLPIAFRYGNRPIYFLSMVVTTIIAGTTPLVNSKCRRNAPRPFFIGLRFR